MSIDPHFAPHSGRDLGPWKRWVEERLKYLASGRNLIDRGSVAGGTVTVREILTNPSALTGFRNVDTMTVTSGGDQPFPLAYRPRDGSEHITWYPNAAADGGGGLHLPASAWSRAGQLVTIPAFDGLGVDDVFTCEYSYFPGQAAAAPSITDPTSGESVADTTPTITGRGEPGLPIAVTIDGVAVGSTTVATDGTWSVTVGSALVPGGHTIVATQTEASGVQTATSSFTTPAPTLPTPVLVGFTSGGDADDAAHTLTFTLPAGVADGHALVLVVRGGVFLGGGEITRGLVCTDPRMVHAYQATAMDGTDPVSLSVWVGFDDGSGDPIVVSVTPDTPERSTFAVGVLGAWSGVNGFGAVTATEVGTATPIVEGVAAVALVWARSGTFSQVSTDAPTNYTLVASTGLNYYSAAMGWWYDIAGIASPAGTFSGEGCCVITII